MEFDIDRVRENVQRSDTEDLIARLTVYRTGMEPEALTVIAEELQKRGIAPEEIARFEEQYTNVLKDPRGVGIPCTHCSRPAVTTQFEWHRLFGKIPLLPRTVPVCEDHSRQVPPRQPQSLPN